MRARRAAPGTRPARTGIDLAELQRALQRAAQRGDVRARRRRRLPDQPDREHRRRAGDVRERGPLGAAAALPGGAE